MHYRRTLRRCGRLPLRIIEYHIRRPWPGLPARDTTAQGQHPGAPSCLRLPDDNKKEAKTKRRAASLLKPSRARRTVRGVEPGEGGQGRGRGRGQGRGQGPHAAGAHIPKARDSGTRGALVAKAKSPKATRPGGIFKCSRHCVPPPVIADRAVSYLGLWACLAGTSEGATRTPPKHASRCLDACAPGTRHGVAPLRQRRRFTPAADPRPPNRGLELVALAGNAASMPPRPRFRRPACCATVRKTRNGGAAFW